MQSNDIRILMVSPSLSMQRGNGVTISRLTNWMGGYDFSFQAFEMKKGDLAGLHDIISVWQPALVHFFNANLLDDYSVDCFDRFQIPFVVTMTGTDVNFLPEGGALAQYVARLARSRRIIVFNDTFLTRLCGLSHVLYDLVCVVPQTIELPISNDVGLDRLGLSQEDFVVGAVGGLRAVKDYDFLLDSLIMAKERLPRLKLILVGSFVDASYAQKIMDRLNMYDWMKCYPDVFHEEVAAYMRVCDVVVNTSLAEGQPQAALEAISIGVPALLRSVAGNKEALYGLSDYCMFDSHKELAERLISLADSAMEMDFLREKCHMVAQMQPTMQVEIESYREIYRSVVGCG